MNAVCCQHGHDLLVRVVPVLRTSHFDNIVVANGIDSPFVVIGSAVPSVDFGLVHVFAVVSVLLHDAASQFRLSIGQRSILADLMEGYQAISVG